jgi:hypothetical protein
MSKKIIDIFPPKNESKKKMIIGKTEISSYKPPSFLSKKKNRYFVFLFLILVGFFLYLYFVLPVARIKIWPKTQELNLKTELKIKEDIPVKVLEAEGIVNQQFPATEKFLKESKAEGIIRLYNNYSTRSQTLKARTRFVSPDRKQFRTPTQVVIPGKRREGGRWIPGTIDVRVVADQPGEEFNIGPTYFAIPGFLGLARYHKIYGRSYQSMFGSMIEETIRVSAGDLKTAKDVLEPLARDKCLTSLRDKILPGFDFLKEEIEIEVLERVTDVKVGTEIEKFNFQVGTRCRALTFKTGDIENFTNNFILAQLPENKAVISESLRIDKSVKEQTINLNLFFDIYSVIDKSFLQKELMGKSLKETRFFLEELPQINRVYVEFWPFWVESVPRELDKIKIELKFDEFD